MPSEPDTVFLDGTTLSDLLVPNTDSRNRQCFAWLHRCLDLGMRVFIPSIAAYEFRRYLLWKVGKAREYRTALERFEEMSDFVLKGLSGDDLSLASELWAELRSQGIAFSSDKSVDCDTLIGAQVRRYAETSGSRCIVATDNTKHLRHLVSAATWRDHRHGLGSRQTDKEES